METHFHILLILLGFLMLGSPASGIDSTTIDANYGISTFNRSNFPKDFVFGTASSAYQYEGATHEDGRGPSIWDTFIHKYPEKIKDQSNAEVADDSYHQYKEDVRIQKEMGVDAYRFSIAWPRVLPHGKLSKGVNRKGLMYYHKLIDELLANGIQPYVTLFHWDLPQALEDEYGGFLSPLVAKDFGDFVDLCFREFGHKVKHWITLNEPWTYGSYGYAYGYFAPGRCSAWQKLNCTGGDSGTEPYVVVHNLLLSHATAVDVYRRKYQAVQKGKIGITLVTHWFEPISQARHNVNAALRSLDFMLGWFMDPITTGDYPRSMLSLVRDRLPKFSVEQSKLLKGSYDFIGLNYYTGRYAVYSPILRTLKHSYITDAIANQTNVRNGVLIGPQAPAEFNTYPMGLYKLLRYIKDKYNSPVIYITENGLPEDSNDKLSLEESLADTRRVKFYHDHLYYMQRAMRAGVNVKGYFAWSLLDNYEWNSGYTLRFGLHFVDFKDGLRIRHPKLSAKWFKKFLQKLQ